MARPRVFISSTYYDMRALRDDLDRFVRDQGYEAVRHERGHIAYGAEEKPEYYAYREIDLCDILVCIIGGRYGTPSSHDTYSITQKELKTALDRGKTVYIFIESNVQHEHRFYLVNKASPDVKYTAVDNIRVHEFVEEITAVAKGNPIFTFSVSADIMRLLQEQWAGLFQRLLQENAARPQTALIDELQRSLATVGDLVQFLSDQNKANKEAINDILFANHPLFVELRKALSNPYRLYFRNIPELEDWLIKARGYFRAKKTDPNVPKGYVLWFRPAESKGKKWLHFVEISTSLFHDDETLLAMNSLDWKPEYLRVRSEEIKPKAAPNAEDLDDDIPF